MYRPFLIGGNGQKGRKIKIHRLEKCYVLSYKILLNDIKRIRGILLGQQIDGSALE